MSKIETNLPTIVLSTLAEACGFRIVFDHSMLIRLTPNVTIAAR